MRNNIAMCGRSRQRCDRLKRTCSAERGKSHKTARAIRSDTLSRDESSPCSAFAVDDISASVRQGKHAEIILGVLPPIIHIRKESDKAALRWCLERMMQGLRGPQPGGILVAQHLAPMLLVQAPRLHLAEGMKGGVGWLFALADRQMSAAINAMHDDPAHRWTLQELGKRAGMSRTTFAVKFKETVVASPVEYLTRWRMLLAGDKLVNSGDPVSVIARRSATNPKAPSAQPSRGLWAVRHGNIAAAGIRLLLHIARVRPPAPIGLNLSQVDIHGWRLLRASNPVQRYRNPAARVAAATVSASAPGVEGLRPLAINPPATRLCSDR